MPTVQSKLNKSWFVYMILCDDDSLYTGITLDLDIRLAKHKSGKGAKYTRSHGVKELVFSEQHYTHKQALARELEIKKLSRKKKVDLVKSSKSKSH